jgi:hypothetical protein
VLGGAEGQVKAEVEVEIEAEVEVEIEAEVEGVGRTFFHKCRFRQEVLTIVSNC